MAGGAIPAAPTAAQGIAILISELAKKISGGSLTSAAVTVAITTAVASGSQTTAAIAQVVAAQAAFWKKP